MMILSAVMVSCGSASENKTMSPTIDEPDVQVLEELKKAGSDLSKPHLIEFYLYFPSKESASEVAQTLRDEGYEVQVSLGADNINWLCFATKSIFPTREALSAIRVYFEALAQQQGGEYDGWGTTIVK